MSIIDESCFVIGNGESRNIFGNLEQLKGKGTIYGCNAIYRDWPNLCDKIFAVDKGMYEEIIDAKKQKPFPAEIISKEQFSSWNYLNEGDTKNMMPKDLQLYRFWIGGNNKTGVMRKLDLSLARGTGVSAVLHAAEKGFKHIFMIAFDMLGAEQWAVKNNMPSRKQNNIYKNTRNYPSRMNMKAYLKYEWLYQITQISRKFPNCNFYLINRKEYIKGNKLLSGYINFSKNNFYGAHYAELKKFIDNPENPCKFFKFSIQK